MLRKIFSIYFVLTIISLLFCCSVLLYDGINATNCGEFKIYQELNLLQFSFKNLSYEEIPELLDAGATYLDGMLESGYSRQGTMQLLLSFSLTLPLVNTAVYFVLRWFRVQLSTFAARTVWITLALDLVLIIVLRHLVRDNYAIAEYSNLYPVLYIRWNDPPLCILLILSLKAASKMTAPEEDIHCQLQKTESLRVSIYKQAYPVLSKYSFESIQYSDDERKIYLRINNNSQSSDDIPDSYLCIDLNGDLLSLPRHAENIAKIRNGVLFAYESSWNFDWHAYYISEEPDIEWLETLGARKIDEHTYSVYVPYHIISAEYPDL